MNIIVPLWSVPRSISTAFERMMMERGDFKVIHEPFSYFFYAKEQAAAAIGMNVDPSHPQDFNEILKMIQTEAENMPVFFKDMAYHAVLRADEKFMSQFANTFIIRDPAITLVSHYKMNPDFTWDEAGFEAELKLFDMVVKQTGKIPAVVDAEDIIANPHKVVQGYCEVVGIPYKPEALYWGAEFKPEWKTWETWHLDTAKSTGFAKDMEPFDFTVNDVPRLKEMYERAMPYYEPIYKHRILP